MRCCTELLVFATLVAGGSAKQGTKGDARDASKLSRHRYEDVTGHTTEKQITKERKDDRDEFKSKAERFNLEKVIHAENKYWAKIMTDISSLQTHKPTLNPTSEQKECIVDVSNK